MRRQKSPALSPEEVRRRKRKIDFIVRVFSREKPNATTELRYRNPYELVVATMLSAQCTDARVNQITPRLFERFPTVESLAKASPGEVYEYIRSCTYPNSKARRLVQMAQTVMKEFGGEIPRTAEDLRKLPGIGRKSAHVIASTLYGEPVLGVDTHVFRVGKRLGLHNARTPEQAEREMAPLIPESVRPRFHHWLILHGRYVCRARRPRCEACPLTSVCDAYQTGQISGR